MKLINLMILIFLMSAFAIGVATTDMDKSTLNDALNNALQSTTQNFSLSPPQDSSIDNPYINVNLNGFFLILEKYIQFLITLFVEVMRIGINFGHDNPQYFTPNFIITIIKLLIYIAIISLLVKPFCWLVAFIIIGIISLKDKLKKRKKFKHKENE